MGWTGLNEMLGWGRRTGHGADGLPRRPHRGGAANTLPQSLVSGRGTLVSAAVLAGGLGLSYSDRVIEGSPKNSVRVVPVDAATKIPLR